MRELEAWRRAVRILGGRAQPAQLACCGPHSHCPFQRPCNPCTLYLSVPGKLKFSLAGGSSFSAHLHAYTPSMPGDRPAAARAAAAAQAAAAAPPCAAGQLGEQEQEQPGAPSGSHDGPQHATTGVPTKARAAGDAEAAAQEGQWPPPQAGAGAGAGALCGQLQHPRSAWLRERLPDPEANFRVLAKVGSGQRPLGTLRSSLVQPPLCGAIGRLAGVHRGEGRHRPSSCASGHIRTCQPCSHHVAV